MPRILACLDAVPAPDGSCVTAAYVEQPSPWPALTVEQGQLIGSTWLMALVGVLIVKLLFKPSTHKRI